MKTQTIPLRAMHADLSTLTAALEILEQGEALLGALSDVAYTRKLAAAYQASIGGHYRHCLEHFQSIVDAPEAGVINYDQRRRDPLIENDRFAALNETRRLRGRLDRLPEAALLRTVWVVCKTSYAPGSSQGAGATVGRELMYAVAHAVHHYALIGIMAHLQNVTLPAGFGIAPSTIQHQQAVVPATADACDRR